MKKVFKIRFLFLVLSIIAILSNLPIPVFAVNYSYFPDVPDNATYANEVNSLAAAGIFNGDENGNFNPDKTMTRAEAATLLVRLFVNANTSAPSTGSFSDVPVSHWAYEYIETAVMYGLINGYGNGRFGPGDSLTYSQSVTLLVRALGFEEMAQELGGWPDGYVMMGNELGITQNTINTFENSVPRSTVAVLVYNAWHENSQPTYANMKGSSADTDAFQFEPESEFYYSDDDLDIDYGGDAPLVAS